MDTELEINGVCEKNFDLIKATFKTIKICYNPF